MPRQLRGGGDQAAKGFVVRLVGGGARGASIDYGANGDSQRLFGHILVNGVVGEAGERIGAKVDRHFGFIGFAQFDNSLGQRLEIKARICQGYAARRLRGGLGAARGCLRCALPDGRHFANATPTLTSRKRAGEAPWPVPMVCWGWPLPQLGVPQRVQWSREQMASQLFQNSVVMPL